MSKSWQVIVPIVIGTAFALTVMVFPDNENVKDNSNVQYSSEEEWEERPAWITDNGESYIVEVYRQATDNTNVARITSKILKSRYGVDDVSTDTNFIVLRDTPFEGFTTLGLKSKVKGKLVNVKAAVNEDGVYTFADDYYDSQNLLNTAKEVQKYSNNLPVHRVMYETNLDENPLKNPPHYLYTIGVEGNNYFGYIEGKNSDLDGEYKENITYRLAIDTDRFKEINYDRDLWVKESTDMYDDFAIDYPHSKLDVTVTSGKKSQDYHIDGSTNSFDTQINAFYNEVAGENNTIDESDTENSESEGEEESVEESEDIASDVASSSSISE